MLKNLRGLQRLPRSFQGRISVGDFRGFGVVLGGDATRVSGTFQRVLMGFRIVFTGVLERFRAFQAF